MGIAESTRTVALAVAAKVTDSAVPPEQAVMEGLPIAARLSELDMVSDFL